MIPTQDREDEHVEWPLMIPGYYPKSKSQVSWVDIPHVHEAPAGKKQEIDF